MDLFEIAREITGPWQLMALIVLCVFAYWRGRTSKALKALSKLPQSQWRDALLVLQAGGLPLLLRRASPKAIDVFARNFDSRQKTLRLVVSVVAIVILGSTVLHQVEPVPPVDVPQIQHITCWNRADGSPVGSVAIDFAPTAGMRAPFSIYAQASNTESFESTIGHQYIANPSHGSLEFDFDRTVFTENSSTIFVRLVVVDQNLKVRRRGAVNKRDVYDTSSSNCEE